MSQGKLLLGSDDMIDTYLQGSRAQVVRDLVEVISAAGSEWDRDCAAAFEVGLFDVNRNQWIADAVTKELARWESPKPYTSRSVVRDMLVEISESAENFDDDCGLPTYSDDEMDLLIDHVIDRLDLRSSDD